MFHKDHKTKPLESGSRDRLRTAAFTDRAGLQLCIRKTTEYFFKIRNSDSSLYFRGLPPTTAQYKLPDIQN